MEKEYKIKSSKMISPKYEDALKILTKTVKEFRFPDGITKINSYVLQDNTLLENVYIPEGVTTIGSSAFSNCDSLISINLPDSLTRIENSAFYDCDNLISVTIPPNVNYIGSSAFYTCDNLYVIYNNSSLSISPGSNSNNGYIGYYAKVVITNGKKEYLTTDGYTYTYTDDCFLFRYKDKYELICYAGPEKNITLPTSINGNSYDLYYFIGGKNITIPEGITVISNKAFYESKSINSVVLPSTLKTIGGWAFSSCSNLKEINLNNIETINTSTFYGCGFKTITIPSSLLTIAENSFAGCKNLEEVIIEEGVSIIDDDAFRYCDKLKKVIVPKSITKLNWGCFNGCSVLKNFYYNGTKADWKNVYKGYNWNNDTKITKVICKDGEVEV